MKDHTVLELLEILSSSRIGIDALTTRVAIFGVLQHAHASATEGDEFGIEYVRAFLAQLKQRTAEHRKVLKISLVLQQKLQEKCDHVQSQIRSLGTLSSLTSPSLESRPAATADPQDPTARPVREQSTHKNGLSLQQEILGIEPGAPVPNEPAAKRTSSLEDPNSSTPVASSSHNPVPMTAKGGAEPVAIVQIDKYGVARAIYPLPQTVAERLLSPSEPGRFLEWCKTRFILDIESGMRINVRSLRSAYQSTYQDNPPQHRAEIWRMMNKVFKSVGFHNKSDPDLIGIRVREYPVEANKDQSTAISHSSTSRAANGKVAEPAAFVQTDKHGVRKTIPPRPQSALDLLLGLDEPGRFMKWLTMRFVLDNESEMQIQASGVGSAYQSTCQGTPPELNVVRIYGTTTEVFEGVEFLRRSADGSQFVFQGLRAREFPVKADTGQALQGETISSPGTAGLSVMIDGTRDVNPVAPGGVANGSDPGMREVYTGASES
jgi:hypothetical protein